MIQERISNQVNQDYENTKNSVNSTEENPILRKEEEKFFEKNNHKKLKLNSNKSDKIRDPFKKSFEKNLITDATNAMNRQTKSNFHNLIKLSSESKINFFLLFFF